ncbi:hypothetical protein [Paenibacillus gorillae]|uniref:hypothetical protein n=1 Tax=Paenibacillus gorillae TaxID=1243662 RepID=UPI0004B5F244|nr:hypothetical protein [Paenibacillus gorillae]
MKQPNLKQQPVKRPAIESSRPRTGTGSQTSTSLLSLQQQVGNQFVLQLMGSKPAVKRGREEYEQLDDESEELEEEQQMAVDEEEGLLEEVQAKDAEKKIEQPVKKLRTEANMSSGSELVQLGSDEQIEESDEETDNESTVVWEGKRPSFTTASKRAAFISTSRDPSYGVTISDYRKPKLTEINGAMPHRMSYNDIRNNALKLMEGKETATDFNRWTDRFITAGQEKIDLRKKEQVGKGSDAQLKQLITDMETSQQQFITARNNLASSPTNKSVFEAFIKQANSFHANVPDVGPHFGVNNPVQENAHMHVETVSEPQPDTTASGDGGADKSPAPPKLTRRLSIMSRQVRRMSIGRISAFPYSSDGKLITTDGSTVSLDDLPKEDREAIEKHKKKTVKGYDPDFKFGKDAD